MVGRIDRVRAQAQLVPDVFVYEREAQRELYGLEVGGCKMPPKGRRYSGG
jgi:hypothetical protein